MNFFSACCNIPLFISNLINFGCSLCILVNLVKDFVIFVNFLKESSLHFTGSSYSYLLVFLVYFIDFSPESDYFLPFTLLGFYFFFLGAFMCVAKILTCDVSSFWSRYLALWSCLLEPPALYPIGLGLSCLDFHPLLKAFYFLPDFFLDPFSFCNELFRFHEFVYFLLFVVIIVVVDIQL